MKCEIIKDLLPNYIDGLTSRESNEAIEQHLETCSSCAKYLNDMKADMKEAVKEDRILQEVTAGQIDPLLKIRRSVIRKIFFAVLITAVVCGIFADIYRSYYYGGIQAEEGDVEIVTRRNGGLVVVEFCGTNDKIKIDMLNGTEEREAEGKGEGALRSFMPVKYRKQPLETIPGESSYNFTFLDENTYIDYFSIPEKVTFDEDDYIIIEYVGEAKKIRLTDLYYGNTQ